MKQYPFSFLQLAFGLLLLLPVACGSVRPGETQTETMEGCQHRLSFTDNEVTLRPVMTENAQGLIKIEVNEVENPDKFPFSIIVSLLLPNNQQALEIGNFSLFPANNPGNYTFDLNNYAVTRELWTDLSVLIELGDGPPEQEERRKINICVRDLEIR